MTYLFSNIKSKYALYTHHQTDTNTHLYTNKIEMKKVLKLFLKMKYNYYL